MKAFAFRLEQALRWRETQVELQKSRVAAAAGRLAEIEAAIRARQAELSEASEQATKGGDSVALLAFAGLGKRSRQQIRAFEAQAAAAREALNMERNRLVEADRKLRTLENFKRKERSDWLREFDRELAAFADEAYLYRLKARDGRE